MRTTISSTSSVSAAFVTFLCTLLITFALIHDVDAASADQWRGRSIYQIITDRFSLPDGSTSKECITEQKLICGGTWLGIIKNLDYIQGMGFTAVSIPGHNDTIFYICVATANVQFLVLTALDLSSCEKYPRHDGIRSSVSRILDTRYLAIEPQHGH